MDDNEWSQLFDSTMESDNSFEGFPVGDDMDEMQTHSEEGITTTSEEVHTCSECNRTFSSTQGLRIHAGRMHPLAIQPSISPDDVEQEPDRTETEPNIVQTEICNLEDEMHEAYETVIKWKRNIFDLPKGNFGKQYVSHITGYILEW